MELVMSFTNDSNDAVLNLYDKGGSFDGLVLDCAGFQVQGAGKIIKELRSIAWGSSAASKLLQAMESRWPGLRAIK